MTDHRSIILHVTVHLCLNFFSPKNLKAIRIVGVRIIRVLLYLTLNYQYLLDHFYFRSWTQNYQSQQNLDWVNNALNWTNSHLQLPMFCGKTVHRRKSGTIPVNTILYEIWKEESQAFCNTERRTKTQERLVTDLVLFFEKYFPFLKSIFLVFTFSHIKLKNPNFDLFLFFLIFFQKFKTYI